MDHDGFGGLAIRHLGIEETDALGERSLEYAHEFEAAVAHGPGFDPGTVLLRSDDKDFQLRTFEHAVADAPSDLDGTHELVFDVNRSLRPCDRRQNRILDFFRVAVAGQSRFSSLDQNSGIRKMRLQIGRPYVRSVHEPGGAFVTSKVKSSSCKFAKSQRRIAVHHELDIVKRRIGLSARVDAVAGSGGMGVVVPSANGEVEPARESQRVIDHHEFLVLCRA